MSVDMNAVVAPDDSIVFAHPDETEAEAKLQERIEAGALEGEYKIQKFVARGVERENEHIDVSDDSKHAISTTRYYRVETDDGPRIRIADENHTGRLIERGDVLAETRSAILIVVRGYDGNTIEVISGRYGQAMFGINAFIQRIENGEWYHRGAASDPDGALLETAEQADARPGGDTDAAESVRRELSDREIS